MHPNERRRLAEAFAFALDAHGDQTRKGKEVPYASHLIQVAGLVLEFGGDSRQAIAGLLHDVIEDCDVELHTLRERFGADVADIVAQCTDLVPGDRADDKSPWIERKEHYLERIRAAPRRCRLVAACDKLHNLRDLAGDLQQDGIETLAPFTATPSQTRWYYESVRAALGDDLPPKLLAEFDALLRTLAEYLPG